MYAKTLSLNCSIWLRYFYIFAVMTQATKRTFILPGAWWSPKRPLDEENSDSKLIYALLYILMIPHEDLEEQKLILS